MRGNLFMLQHPEETPESSYQPHLHFYHLKELQVMLSLWTQCTCVFSIFSTGGGQQVFSVSKELKMYFILLSPILVPFSFSHFCYQIWVLGYWSIVFGQVPLISALSSIPRRVARLQQHSRELFLCCWQKRQVETLNSRVPISTVWLGSCASWVMSPVHSILLPALRPSSYRCFGRNSFNRQTQ